MLPQEEKERGEVSQEPGGDDRQPAPLGSASEGAQRRGNPKAEDDADP